MKSQLTLVTIFSEEVVHSLVYVVVLPEWHHRQRLGEQSVPECEGFRLCEPDRLQKKTQNETKSNQHGSIHPNKSTKTRKKYIILSCAFKSIFNMQCETDKRRFEPDIDKMKETDRRCRWHTYVPVGFTPTDFAYASRISAFCSCVAFSMSFSQHNERNTSTSSWMSCRCEDPNNICKWHSKKRYRTCLLRKVMSPDVSAAH